MSRCTSSRESAAGVGLRLAATGGQAESAWSFDLNALVLSEREREMIYAPSLYKREGERQRERKIV
jgi:hypothetical protein